MLAQDHAIQDKLRAEVGALLLLLRRGEDKGSNNSVLYDDHDGLSYNEVEKLPYLDHFLKEVLRVYPPGELSRYLHIYLLLHYH